MCIVRNERHGWSLTKRTNAVLGALRKVFEDRINYQLYELTISVGATISAIVESNDILKASYPRDSSDHSFTKGQERLESQREDSRIGMLESRESCMSIDHCEDQSCSYVNMGTIARSTVGGCMPESVDPQVHFVLESAYM
jgi:hypothetical protein